MLEQPFLSNKKKSSRCRNIFLILLSVTALSSPFVVIHFRNKYAQHIISECNTTFGILEPLMDTQLCQRIRMYERLPSILMTNCPNGECSITTYYFYYPFTSVYLCNTTITFETETLQTFTIRLPLYFENLPYERSNIKVLYNRQNPNISSVWYTGIMSDHQFMVYELLRVMLFLFIILFIVVFCCNIVRMCDLYCSKEEAHETLLDSFPQESNGVDVDVDEY
jgi:hypothetical protein